MAPPLLSLRNVTVMRGNCAALREVNLELAAGEHVCILGPNGCGKSTLIKTITRECYPLAGDGCSISILGRERWNIFELRSLLGIVSPDLLASCTTEANNAPILAAMLEELRELPHVGDIRQLGYMVGIELVEDQESRRPFDLTKGRCCARAFCGSARPSTCCS